MASTTPLPGGSGSSTGGIALPSLFDLEAMRGRILHNGAEIKLFQDLSQLTLQNRRALRPLLEALRSRNIQCRWKFPFALSALFRGRSALLQTPKDLQSFCEQLDLPHVKLPEWYAFYFPTDLWLPVSLHPLPKAQHHRSRRCRDGPSSPQGPP